MSSRPHRAPWATTGRGLRVAAAAAGILGGWAARPHRMMAANHCNASSTSSPNHRNAPAVGPIPTPTSITLLPISPAGHPACRCRSGGRASAFGTSIGPHSAGRRASPSCTAIIAGSFSAIATAVRRRGPTSVIVRRDACRRGLSLPAQPCPATTLLGCRGEYKQKTQKAQKMNVAIGFPAAPQQLPSRGCPPARKPSSASKSLLSELLTAAVKAEEAARIAAQQAEAWAEQQGSSSEDEEEEAYSDEEEEDEDMDYEEETACAFKAQSTPQAIPSQ